MGVALVPCGARRLVGQEHLVILLYLGPTPITSAGARRGSTPANHSGARLWYVAD